MYKALEDSVKLSEKLASIGDFAFRVWMYGLVSSDIIGRFTANPKMFRVIAMPLVEHSDDDVKRALIELDAAGLIHLYQTEKGSHLVYHKHDEYNKAMKNFRHKKSKWPTPQQGLCQCVVFLNNENLTVVTTVPTVVVPVNVPVHVPDYGPVLVPEVSMAISILKDKKCPDGGAMLRRYVESWVARFGGPKTHAMLNALPVGLTIFEIVAHFKEATKEKEKVGESRSEGLSASRSVEQVIKWLTESDDYKNNNIAMLSDHGGRTYVRADGVWRYDEKMTKEKAEYEKQEKQGRFGG